MGELIDLKAHRARAISPAGGARTTFFFDLACPFSYLTAERVERTLGEAKWVPVSARALRGGRAVADTTRLRERAQARAAQLHLPLIWPDRFPADARRALRAAAHAAEIGAGPRFALAASRLAFCGGFDLEDPETLAEAAAAAGVPLDGCLQAARDLSRDAPLRAAAERLRALGVGRVPAIEVGGRGLQGESALGSASALLRGGPAPARRLAPVS